MQEKNMGGSEKVFADERRLASLKKFLDMSL
jgi:hypothetical protein